MKYLSQYLAGKKAVSTVQEAREQAIAWQNWESDQHLTYGELSEWLNYFETLGEKFNLTAEFKENGII